MKNDKPVRSPPAAVSPWLPFETRRRARDEKREAVLQTAVRLFLEQGYHRATLDEVARRLNITKPALYNYFRSKEEILFECWSIGRELIEKIIAEIEAEGGTGLFKLRKLIRGCAEGAATDYAAMAVQSDVRDLTESHAKIVGDGNKRIDRVFRNYIAEGITDGSIGPCDVKLSAFAIGGALSWIARWYRREGALSPQEIAAEFAIRLTEGIAKKPARKYARSESVTTPAKRRPSRRGAP
jgi:AcrR family transcriptional regulator